MKIVVKVGGAQLEQATARAEFCASVATAAAAGHRLVIVHGGGNQVREWTQRLGIVDRYHEGLRITDADTADVVTAVLTGLVNKQLVAALSQAGVRAVGLSGADGAIFSARRHAPDGADLGYVGEVGTVDPALLETLLETGIVPVVATVAPLQAGSEGSTDHLYNVNADMAAAPLAHALEADALLFLTDVVGVCDRTGALIPQLSADDATALRREGTLTGGMIPKVAVALAATSYPAPALVKIAPAAGPDAVRRALTSDVGTVFVNEFVHGDATAQRTPSPDS